MRLLLRPFIAALVGGLLGAAILTAAYLRDPGLAFEMDTPLPPFISGIHSPERDGDTTFAWTSGHVGIDLRSLDRHAPWSCTLRFRAPRPPNYSAPRVTVQVDVAQIASVTGGAEFMDLGFTIPAASRGPQVAMFVTPVFTPGTADTRILGIQIDRLQCRPTAMAWPPSRAMQQVGAAAGYVALMFSLLAFSVTGWVAGAVAVAVGASLLLTTAGGVYGDYSNSVLLMTVLVIAISSGLPKAIERAGGSRLSPEARAAFAVSCIALLLKLIGLMHPAKPVIDAMFHAHRLDWVLGGRYLFTQPFVGDVEMPYAIGLYVFAAPWAWVTPDHLHVGLIRTVAAASDVLAGLLLYPIVTRAWGDRRAAVLAVLFYQLAPLSYAVLGNANLTNLFGQSVAIAVVAAAVSWRLDVRRAATLLAFTGLVAWAFLSHVSTVTMLLAVLGAMVVLYFWRGDAARRRAALGIVVAAAAALAVSWVIYYQYFSAEIFGAFGRMFSGGASETPASAAEAARGYIGMGGRVADLLSQARDSVGWPLAILAAVGTWSIWRDGKRDRLVSALMAWAAMWIVFSASTVLSQVDKEFVRYTIEFLGRINLAVIPMVAILAARGAAAGWTDATPASARKPLRVLSIVLIAWAVVVAMQSLLGWFDR